MQDYHLLAVLLLVSGAMALPDFSQLIPGTSEHTPNDEFKYGPFFQMYTGTPPTSTPPAPTYPPIPLIIPHPPVQAPVLHPPVQAPLPNPPVQAPFLHPPIEAPFLHPPVQAPVLYPPVQAPIPHPPVQAPIPHPPVQAPILHPPVQAPVQAPVLYPPVQAPVIHPPVQAPVLYPPIQAPVLYPPVQAPVLHPPEAPIPHPPAQAPVPHPPVYTPIEPPEPTPPVTWNTRTAFYQFQWGAVTDGCRFRAPSAILKCLDGGILLTHDQSNADCESLALDVTKCSQVDQGTDSIVDFQCVGNTAMHLAANVRTLPSEAVECNFFNGNEFGGKAATAASLGRFCRDPATGGVNLANTYSCVEGQDDFVDGNQFCTSLSQCIGEDCRAFVEPLEITALDENPACSTPEVHQDLTDFRFNPSTLASFNVLSWTFSDIGFNCDWTVPNIEISCRNGGFPRLVQQVPFCHSPVESEMPVIVCTNPNPNSSDGRIIVELEFWCFGNSAEQLVLDARTMATDESGYSCEAEGLMVHGLEISRGCGQFQSDTFTLFKSPSFCSDPEQFHQEICFAGFSCPADVNGCNDITLESVGVETSDPAVQSCIYAEQLS